MQNLTSTETIILVSLLTKKMPNLHNYIVEYSTSKSAKQPTIEPTKTLSMQQIQEACRHPNNIMSQTLRAIITLQEASNTINNKTENLIKQHNALEKILVKLLAFYEKGQK